MASTYYSVIDQEIVSQDSGASFTDFGADALDSVIACVDDASHSTCTLRYKPYGTSLEATGASLPKFRWVGTLGYRFGATAFSECYVRARHYGCLPGSWASADPLWPREMAYSYCTANPTTLSDISGLAGGPTPGGGGTGGGSVTCSCKIYTYQKWATQLTCYSGPKDKKGRPAGGSHGSTGPINVNCQIDCPPRLGPGKYVCGERCEGWENVLLVVSQNYNPARGKWQWFKQCSEKSRDNCPTELDLVSILLDIVPGGGPVYEQVIKSLGDCDNKFREPANPLPPPMPPKDHKGNAMPCDTFEFRASYESRFKCCSCVAIN